MNVEAPKKIRLEAASVCQLRCPLCPTTRGEVRAGAAGAGFLSLENFKKFLAHNPAAKTVELSNYGEIFLNPELIPILEYAWEKKVVITIVNGANLNNVSDEALGAVVKYRVKAMTVSIDGASQQTYEQYRIRGSIETVLENVRKINAFKRKYQTAAPILLWQFVVFGHNEHEIETAREMASELGMLFYTKNNWDPSFSPSTRQKQTPSVPPNADIPLDVIGKPQEVRPPALGQQFFRTPCSQLWLEPQVNWDGKVLGCCVNYWSEFGGNAFEQPQEEWLNSPKMHTAREMLQGRAEASDDIPCTGCGIYKEMLNKNRFWVVPDKLSRQAASVPNQVD